MPEQELNAYQGLKKQGAFLISSPRFGLAVASTKLPNITVTVPFRIPVTTFEYLNQHRYIPEYYQRPNILKQKLQLYEQGCNSNNIDDTIIFRWK